MGEFLGLRGLGLDCTVSWWTVDLVQIPGSSSTMEAMEGLGIQATTWSGHGLATTGFWLSLRSSPRSLESPSAVYAACVASEEGGRRKGTRRSRKEMRRLRGGYSFCRQAELLGTQLVSARVEAHWTTPSTVEPIQLWDYGRCAAKQHCTSMTAYLQLYI